MDRVDIALTVSASTPAQFVSDLPTSVPPTPPTLSIYQIYNRFCNHRLAFYLQVFTMTNMTGNINDSNMASTGIADSDMADSSMYAAT